MSCQTASATGHPRGDRSVQFSCASPSARAAAAVGAARRPAVRMGRRRNLIPLAGGIADCSRLRHDPTVLKPLLLGRSLSWPLRARTLCSGELLRLPMPSIDQIKRSQRSEWAAQPAMLTSPQRCAHGLTRVAAALGCSLVTLERWCWRLLPALCYVCDIGCARPARLLGGSTGGRDHHLRSLTCHSNRRR